MNIFGEIRGVLAHIEPSREKSLCSHYFRVYFESTWPYVAELTCYTRDAPRRVCLELEFGLNTYP